MKKVKYLGIDFGSSNTVVTAMTEDEEIYIFAVDGVKAEFESVAVMVKKAGTNEYDEFYAHAYIDGYEAAKNGKRSLKLRNKLKENIKEYDIKKLCKGYFAFLVKSLNDINEDANFPIDLSDLDKATVCFGYPAYYEDRESEEYCEIMRELISGAFGCKEENIKCAEEPVLAAYAYNYVNQDRFLNDIEKSPLQNGTNLLILDFGGHTLDIGIMTAGIDEDNNKITLSQITKSKSFKSKISLGKHITVELGKALSDDDERYFDWEIDKAKCELFGFGDDGYERRKVRKLSQRGVWFDLTYRADDSGSSADDVKHISLEDIGIDGMLDSLVSRVHAFLEKNFDGQIGAILYAGGASKMKPLRDRIRLGISEFCVPNVVECSLDDKEHSEDSRCKKLRKVVSEYISDEGANPPLSSMNGVALGALLMASGKCEASEVSYYQSKSTDPENRRVLEENDILKDQIEQLENDKNKLTQNLSYYRLRINEKDKEINKLRLIINEKR